MKNVQPHSLSRAARVMFIPARCDFKNPWKIPLPPSQPRLHPKWNNKRVAPLEESSDFYKKASSSATWKGHFIVTIFHPFLETKRKTSMKATRDRRREVGGSPSGGGMHSWETGEIHGHTCTFPHTKTVTHSPGDGDCAE